MFYRFYEFCDGFDSLAFDRFLKVVDLCFGFDKFYRFCWFFELAIVRYFFISLRLGSCYLRMAWDIGLDLGFWLESFTGFCCWRL